MNSQVAVVIESLDFVEVFVVANIPGVFDGVVHGRTIQLTREPGLPDGQLCR